jgi:hypothetical protein
MIYLNIFCKSGGQSGACNNAPLQRLLLKPWKPQGRRMQRFRGIVCGPCVHGTRSALKACRQHGQPESIPKSIAKAIALALHKVRWHYLARPSTMAARWHIITFSLSFSFSFTSAVRQFRSGCKCFQTHMIRALD